VDFSCHIGRAIPLLLPGDEAAMRMTSGRVVARAWTPETGIPDNRLIYPLQRTIPSVVKKARDRFRVPPGSRGTHKLFDALINMHHPSMLCVLRLPVTLSSFEMLGQSASTRA
jgi:hypothetical protein